MVGDDLLIALLPGHEKAVRDIVPEVENLMELSSVVG